MLDKVQTDVKDTQAEMQLPFNLVEARDRSAVLFTRLNELAVKTVRAVWESQTELLRLGVEQGSKAFTPSEIGEDLNAAISAYCDQLHEQTDRMVAQIRRVNDVCRDYGWRLAALYADSLRQAAKQSQASQRAGR